MKNGYDNVSLFYDRLSKIIFGNALLQAQESLLAFIPPRAKVLIAGGGSGWILEAIAKVHHSGLSITYIDASPKMIAKSMKRDCGDNLVVFIAKQVQEETLDREYDVIITPFLFDNFTDHDAALIFETLTNVLTIDGLWLYTDFQNTKHLHHQALLKSMYFFFGLFCGLKVRQLPDMDSLFKKADFISIKEYIFLNGFVSSRVNRINSTTKS